MILRLSAKYKLNVNCRYRFERAVSVLRDGSSSANVLPVRESTAAHDSRRPSSASSQRHRRSSTRPAAGPLRLRHRLLRRPAGGSSRRTCRLGGDGLATVDVGRIQRIPVECHYVGDASFADNDDGTGVNVSAILVKQIVAKYLGGSSINHERSGFGAPSKAVVTAHLVDTATERNHGDSQRSQRKI